MSVQLAVVGQSIRINAVTGIDLTGATSVIMKYRSPSDIEVEVNATISDISTGAIYIDIAEDVLTVGDWYVMYEIVSNDVTYKSFGSIVRVLKEYAVV